MIKFYESELEKAVIELLVQTGFKYCNGDEIKRSEKDVLLQDDLQAYLKTHYTDLTPSEIQKIISRLELVPSEPLYTGSKLAFSIINEGIILPRDQANLPAVHIRLIDFDCVENNRFRVVNQFKVIGEHERIPDVILFINGIPVTIMELKSPINEDVNIYDAWKQIHIRYHRDIPKLLKYTFLSVISDGANNRLGSVFTSYDYYYTWNRVDDEKSAAQNGIGTLLSLIEGALAPKRLLALLRDFIYYPDKSDNQTVVIARYPQFFAANKIFDNIKAHLRPMGDGKGGTYFGATGCGKTYTMLYLTRLLIQRDQDCFHNPTVIIITDREDLDSQAAKIFTNAKTFLGEEEVLSIESRQDLANKLKAKPSGGVYLTTIQKFAEYTGLLSSRNNIICISDEAHRTQTGVEQKLQIDEYGVKVKYGFAKYLRDAFPNATYVGFTGTPIDETLAVFGEVVDKYTMKQASDDGITVRIAYEPRLARVLLSDEKAKEIQRYYDSCAEAGSTEHEIERSKKEMSRMRQILAHPERLHLLAADMVEHYEALCAENPAIVKKAMIVCSDRQIAYQLLQNIVALRPEWGIAKKCDNPSTLSEKDFDKLIDIEKIKLVATRNENDPPELYQACGTKEYRKELDRQFKNTQSNFQIAVVVDMWITGFDVPSLAVMYIDKPLQKHTLIQTISRVNRNFEGKEQGIVVDYIGIKNAMMEAIKLYGNDDETPVDDIQVSLSVLRNHIKLLDNILHSFDASDFYQGQSLARLHCLNHAAEYIQAKKETTDRYMGLSKRLKSAYEICAPTGELNDEEIAKCQFFLAVRSIIYKQHTGGEGAPDTEIMNQYVAQMVQAAITSTGVENIIDADSRQELFDAAFEEELAKIDLPISKFHALLNLLKKAIGEYGKTNKVKSIEFNERMKAVVERYNNRDNLAFVNEVVSDFINSLSDEILNLLKELDADRDSFSELGISLEEKAFYDILVSVRDAHQFDYADEKCLILSQKIKVLVDDNAQFSDWALRDDIKNKLNMELTLLLYQNGYPPQWNSEVFDKVLEQAENFKRYH
jgi:type I site-specific deoxyribonuclease, hsdR family